MCDDRKLEGVGVVGHVVGIHFGWDPADHFGNPRSVQQGLASTSLDCEYMVLDRRASSRCTRINKLLRGKNLRLVSCSLVLV